MKLMEDEYLHFQDELFDSGPEFIELAESQLILYRSFIKSCGINALFSSLVDQTKWQEGTIFIAGKNRLIPRLNAWYADNNRSFTYSGIKLQPNRWFTELHKIRQQIFDKLGIKFNSCLVNLYRDGNDSVAWHCDDEPELGRNPLIASVSLGVERKFMIRAINDHKEKYTFTLPNGSLLIMEGEIQHRYEHQVPKEKNIHHPRINLTFRNIID